MVSSSISTTFMVISETHGFQFGSESAGSPLRLPLPRVDVLLHCGDLTQVGGMVEFRNALGMLSKIDAELKLVIAGNHDLELDPNFDPDEPEDHARAIALWSGHEAKSAGVTYLPEGTHTFELSNRAHFTIYASPYQPEFGDWAFGYSHKTDRFNTIPAPGAVSIATSPVPEDQTIHIMMTHGPPKGILDMNDEDENLGCANLLHAVKRARPLLHCFGHIHEGYGKELVDWPIRDDVYRPEETITVTQLHTQDTLTALPMTPGQSTLMLNAALQTGPSEWHNAPWIVQLPLPVKL